MHGPKLLKLLGCMPSGRRQTQSSLTYSVLRHDPDGSIFSTASLKRLNSVRIHTPSIQCLHISLSTLTALLRHEQVLNYREKTVSGRLCCGPNACTGEQAREKERSAQDPEGFASEAQPCQFLQKVVLINQCALRRPVGISVSSGGTRSLPKGTWCLSQRHCQNGAPVLRSNVKLARQPLFLLLHTVGQALDQH